MDLPDGHVTTTTSPATTTTSPATTTTSPTSTKVTPAPNAAPYTQTLPVGHNINNESAANGAQF